MLRGVDAGRAREGYRQKETRQKVSRKGESGSERERFMQVGHDVIFYRSKTCSSAKTLVATFRIGSWARGFNGLSWIGGGA